MTARIEMIGVSKAFPAVRALERVDFRVESGEVHALMGENGAGKSTLIKIMTGALRSDEGEIRLDGRAVEISSPGHARALGIGAVYQEVNLVPTMSVTKNLTLGRQPRRFGLISWGEARDRAREKLKRLKVDIDVERPLGSYSVAVQQLIAIARALEDDTRVLVLDEPTASLDANETELLFQVVRDLKGRGLAIVFITHFIDQVYQIADRISVLRNGRLVGAAPTAELPPLRLISLMLGRELEHVEEQLAASAPPPEGERVLVAEGLGRRQSMAPFDLSLRAGEVVGLAGSAGLGANGGRQAHIRRDTAGFRTPRDWRPADDGAFAAPIAAPGNGLLPRGPQGRGHIRRTHRPRKHCACAAVQTGLAAPAVAEGAGRARRGDDQDARRSRHRTRTSRPANCRAATSRRSCSRDRSFRARAFSFSTSRHAASTSAPTRKS